MLEQMLTCPDRCHVQGMKIPFLDENSCKTNLFLLLFCVALFGVIIVIVRQYSCMVEMCTTSVNRRGQVNLKLNKRLTPKRWTMDVYRISCASWECGQVFDLMLYIADYRPRWRHSTSWCDSCEVEILSEKNRPACVTLYHLFDGISLKSQQGFLGFGGIAHFKGNSSWIKRRRTFNVFHSTKRRVLVKTWAMNDNR